MGKATCSLCKAAVGKLGCAHCDRPCKVKSCEACAALWRADPDACEHGQE